MKPRSCLGDDTWGGTLAPDPATAARARRKNARRSPDQAAYAATLYDHLAANVEARGGRAAPRFRREARRIRKDAVVGLAMARVRRLIAPRRGREARGAANARRRGSRRSSSGGGDPDDDGDSDPGGEHDPLAGRETTGTAL